MKSSLLLRGLVAGFVATQALDWISTVIYENESDEEKARENAARGYMHAYEVAVDRVTRAVGQPLSREQVGTWGWRFHKVFGTLNGVPYALARARAPGIGWGYGLGYGAAFFAVVDEVVMPVSGLTAGPRAYSWKVHARGAVAHILYGVAAETTLRVLERLWPARAERSDEPAADLSSKIPESVRRSALFNPRIPRQAA